MSESAEQSDPRVTEELRRLRKQVDFLQYQLDLVGRQLDQLQAQTSARTHARTLEPPQSDARPAPAPPETSGNDSQAPRKPAAMPPPLPPSWPQPRSSNPQAGAPIPVKPFPAPTNRGDDAGFSLERSIGANWTSWVGGLIVFLGVCFFLKYAWDQGWLRPSPAARVSGALLFGVALLGVGEYLYRRSAATLAAALDGTAIAVIMATFLAASAFFSPPVLTRTASFYGVALAALAGVGIAIRIDRPSLAIIALIGAYLAPVVLSTGSDRSLELLVYLWLLAAVGCTLTALKTPTPASEATPRMGWMALAPLVFIMTTLWFTVWRLDVRSRHVDLARVFLVATYGLFAATCFLISHRAVGPPGRSMPGAGHAPWAGASNTQGATLLVTSTAGVLGGFFLIDTGPSLVFIGWVAVCLAALQLVVASLTRSGMLMVSATLLAGALAAIACALFFDEFALTMAWIALALVMGALAFMTGSRWARLWAGGPLLLATIHLCTVGLFDTTLQASFITTASLTISRWLLLAWGLAIAYHLLAWLNPRPGGYAPLRERLANLLSSKVWLRTESAQILGDVVDAAPAADGSVLSYARVKRSLRDPADGFGPFIAILGSVLLVGATEFRIDRDWVVTLLLMWSIPLLALIPQAARLGYAIHAAAILWYASVRWAAADNLLPLVENWPRAKVVLTPLANHAFLNGVALCVIGAMAVLQARREKKRSEPVLDAGVALIMFGLLTFETLRFVDAMYAHKAGERDLSMARHMALSILWALIGFATVVAGFKWKLSALRYAALALLGVTVVKVLLVDMARVAAIWRILSFLAVGALLLGVSYIYSRNPQSSSSEAS